MAEQPQPRGFPVRCWDFPARDVSAAFSAAADWLSSQKNASIWAVTLFRPDDDSVLLALFGVEVDRKSVLAEGDRHD